MTAVTALLTPALLVLLVLCTPLLVMLASDLLAPRPGEDDLT